jgi:adenosylcobinamide-phosphate synthase
MIFFAIFFALLIEQARPLARTNPIHAGLRAWALSVSRNFDTNTVRHAWVAWALAVVFPAGVTLAVHLLLLWWIGWPAAIVWSVVILYLTLGFRQFSHHFTGIRDALEMGDEQTARHRLAQWQQVDVHALARSEIVRHVLEYSVLAAHRHVFGVVVCFSLGAALGLGPTGAVVYRLAEFVSRYWHYKQRMGVQPVSDALQRCVVHAWTMIDWLPARATAISFAIVGSFEEAIEGMRFHTRRFPNDNDGVVLAATAGAINVRLGGRALHERNQQGMKSADTAVEMPRKDSYPDLDLEDGGSDQTTTPGRPPEIGHLRSVVGLVWRSVVVWLLLLALLTLARLLG